MKVGVIGAGTMGQGIAKAFAQVEGYEVALCDIKQEWADGGKAKIQKGYARLVEKGKMTQEAVDAILAKITPGLKEDLCADCDLIVEAAFEDMGVKKTTFQELDKIAKPECIFASNTSSLSGVLVAASSGLLREETLRSRRSGGAAWRIPLAPHRAPPAYNPATGYPGKRIPHRRTAR